MALETFWMLNKNIDRISAERDQRLALVQIRSQSSEGVSEMMTDLRKQMGVVIEFEAPKDIKIDKAALHRLAGIGDLTKHRLSEI